MARLGSHVGNVSQPAPPAPDWVVTATIRRVGLPSNTVDLLNDGVMSDTGVDRHAP